MRCIGVQPDRLSSPKYSPITISLACLLPIRRNELLARSGSRRYARRSCSIRHSVAAVTRVRFARVGCKLVPLHASALGANNMAVVADASTTTIAARLSRLTTEPLPHDTAMILAGVRDEM